MPSFNSDKFLDFCEVFDSKNPKHVAGLKEFANKAQGIAPELFTDEANWVRVFRTPLTKEQAVSASKEYITSVKAINLSQPDSSTCQSACIAMALGDSNISRIRNELLAGGQAGDPYNMARLINRYTSKYEFVPDASLTQVCDWLKAGEFLITHGWFTGSGHVICLDGVSIDTQTLGFKLNVKDPWSEFDASQWKYNKSSKFYDGYYSSRCIYAACVAGQSVSHAKTVYSKGEMDPSRKGMWVHRFKV